MLEIKNEELIDSELVKNSNNIKIIRGIIVFLFFILLATLLTYFVNNSLIMLIISLCSIITIILINKFTKPIFNRNKTLLAIKRSYKRHYDRRQNNFKNNKDFFDKGNDYKKIFAKMSIRNKNLLEDVDILGDMSLYQNITSAKTVYGRYDLADRLINGSKTKDYDIINKLGNSLDVIYLEAALSHNNIEQGLEKKSYLNTLTSKYQIKPLSKIITMLTIDILLIILVLLKVIPIGFIGAIFLVNLVLAFTSRDVVDSVNCSKISDSIGKFSFVLSEVGKLDLTAIDSNYTSEYFIKEEKTLKKQYALWQVMSYKNNILFKIILDSLIGFSLIWPYIFNHFIVDAKEIDQVLNDISRLEVLTSLSNLVADYNTCIPKESDVLEFTNLANPLVKNCVANDLIVNKGIVLTGSNMSGKTTFLRTIATNMLIYLAGGCPLASSFSSSRYELYTALRSNDKLSEGISSFYAEISKIREMVLVKGKKKLCLIDEIFKGTNTLDRIYGAKELIKKLESLGYDFIISTHDFELCEIETILNYHFSEQYSVDYKEISFDYKLKNGKSESTNAIFLLKSSGVIE